MYKVSSKRSLEFSIKKWETFYLCIRRYKLKTSVADPSHFDVNPDPGIHIWSYWIQIFGSTFGSMNLFRAHINWPTIFARSLKQRRLYFITAKYSIYTSLGRSFLPYKVQNSAKWLDHTAMFRILNMSL